MIRLLVLLITSLVYPTLQAQEARNPDARATEILQQLEEKTNTYSDVTYHFSLKIELAESDPQILKGTFYTRGNQYRLELPDLIFATDGISQWVVNKEAQEIQIHDYEPLDPANLSHPQNLLAIHKNPDFDYRLEFEGAEGDKMVQKIEFKPLQRDSEYSKARIILNSRTGHIDTIEVFSKDGSRYYLTIDSTLINQNLSPSFFQIGKEDFPGFHEEDLRLN
ncbi:MAG: outer membrane lipoprotein carrier protein LolA [Saprospiraceae bacterium]|nr:outer membrane lipoprotein carrier protein LolA [Saprospiraceae bacterium]